MEERGLDFTAYLTWVVVAMPTVMWQLRDHVLFAPRGLIWIACYVAFIVVFFLYHGRHSVLLILIQSLLAVACCCLAPSGFQPTLLVIVAAQLAAQPVALAFPWIVVQSIAVLFSDMKPGLTLLVMLGYVAFQLFAFFSVRIAIREEKARQQLAETNAELHVATELLEMNSRSSERLRIARDLHDVLGHHLAALSINLEVARHLTQGESREQIEKSQSIARHLLSDVREVVSRLREDEAIDLAAAIRSLSGVIHKPSLHVDIASGVAVKDPALAQVALRAIQEIVTNSVRHSGAKNLWLTLRSSGGVLTIESRDDGCGTDDVRFGNGLRGMRERVEEVHGSIEVSSMRGRGFSVQVRLPLAGVTA